MEQLAVKLSGSWESLPAPQMIEGGSTCWWRGSSTSLPVSTVDTRLGLNTPSETEQIPVWRQRIQYRGDLQQLWPGLWIRGWTGEERESRGNIFTSYSVNWGLIFGPNRRWLCVVRTKTQDMTRQAGERTKGEILITKLRVKYKRPKKQDWRGKTERTNWQRKTGRSGLK